MTPVRRASQLLFLLFRVLWLATASLGLLRWFGFTTTWLWLHIGLGLGLTLALLLQSGLAFATGAHRGWASLGMLWALLLPIVGFGQTHWFPGAMHVLVQVMHLLVGLGAIVVAQRINTTQRRVRTT